MSSKVTDLAQWRATHQRPVRDALVWHEAVESALRANVAVAMTVWLTWPRVMLRTMFGV